MNSASDNPNQAVLNAFPLDFVKYLEIVVVAVWDIIPWPENLIKRIPKNKKVTDEIFENKKLEKANRIITKKANLDISISSIFFPNHIKIKLLKSVAEAYIEPNCPCVIESVSLILKLNKPRKKLCPKLEKNVNIKPKIITFKLKFLNMLIYDL